MAAGCIKRCKFGRGGYMMKKFVVAFVILCTSALTVVTLAGEVKEHPLIRPFPGSTLNKNMCDYKDFDEYTFRVLDPKTKKETKTTVRGKFWKLMYTLYKPDGNWDRSHSFLEMKENYKSEARKHGGSILYDGNDLVFTMPSKSGGRTWVRFTTANSAQQFLWIIEEKGFEQKLTFGPAEMKEALDKEGRVQLHGILFDLDKATLKPESTKQLQHIVTLMKNYPKLRLEVQGHTDGQGSNDYNLKLSQRRAETVVAYLGLFGVNPSRLIPKGFGESKPVEPNTTEAGRAKNRRVELVLPKGK